MSKPLTNQPLDTLQELRRELRQGRLVAFVGAGVSMASGYPSWSQLLVRLHDKLGELPAAEGPKYLHQLGRMRDDLWRAEEYRRLLGPAGFEALIWDTFKPAAKGPGASLRALARLPFRHFLTTNYDDLLENAVRATRRKLVVTHWHDNDALSRFLSCLSRPQTPTHVVYLHGRYSEPARIVLAESDYVQRYVVNDDAARKLFALFMTQPVLFVGFSLSDPELTYIMRNVNARLGGGAPHYAILPSPGTGEEAAQARYHEKKFGVRSIFYRATRDHRHLTEILDGLAAPARAKAPKSTSSSRKRRRAVTTEKPAIRAEALVRMRDPDDPNKGRFGGSASDQGWTLSAKVSVSDDPDWFVVELMVTAPDPKNTASRRVKFYLHPTFPERTLVEPVRNGKATTELLAYGAFTVGASVMNQNVRLELDLAELPKAPAKFKNR